MSKQKKPPMPETKLLTTAFSRVESDMIRELLQNAGIPTLVNPHYGLDRIPVLAGSSALGEDIYVFEDKFDEAKDILDGFINGEYTEDGTDEGTDEGADE